MSETKDPAIKLFGKTIPLLSLHPTTHQAPSCEKQVDSKREDGSNSSTSEEMAGPRESSFTNNNPKTPTADKESPTSNDPSEEERNDSTNPKDKTLKKPDKIIPCPRCNSMDTKFCYFNNYNVTQPRHFCKNCQRYWTAGGTMRNVPVGAGRRKNKSISHYRHITVSEALQSSRVDLPNETHYPTIRLNETVLTFGSNTAMCNSTSTGLVAENTTQNYDQSGFHKPGNLKVSVPCRGGEGNDDQSSMSSVTAANLKGENCNSGPNGVLMQNCHGYPPQVPVYAGSPWPYPMNMAQWVPPPGVFPPGYPMPFYPGPPYWGCAVQPPWTVPWVTMPLSNSPTPNSPALGKHGRDENSSIQSDPKEEEKKTESGKEKSLWIPKTLRIDDPGEAARSSIWTTLGIKHGKGDGATDRGGKGSLFKAFQLKADEKIDSSESLPVLQANPAAFSRSQNFQERS